MADRGDYRPFFSAFWDDPDVHALSHTAYRVLTTLKGTLQAAGIGVVYHEVLATRCAMSPEEAELALQELEAPTPGKEVGWIVRERNLIWLVNGLRFEPTLTAANKKHRTFITDRVLAPLGDRPIVQAFRRHYREWFPVTLVSSNDTNSAKSADPTKGIEGQSDGYRMGIEGVSKPSPAQPSPAQPDSNPIQPSPAHAREGAAAAAAGDNAELNREIAAYAEGLAAATNRGITERWGPPEKPIQPFGITRTIATALVGRGVPLEVAKAAIEEKCRTGRVGSVPASVAYFQEAIVEYYHADLQRRHEREQSRATHISRALENDRENRERELESLYVGERGKVVTAWKADPANAALLADLEAAVEQEFPKANAFNGPARAARLVQTVARAAGFPDFDAWKLHPAKAS